MSTKALEVAVKMSTDALEVAVAIEDGYREEKSSDVTRHQLQDINCKLS